MAYRCLACSYQGSFFKGGCCPGCGSANIAKVQPSGSKAPVARKPYRLMLALALWVYLVVEVWRTLAGS